MPDSLPRPQRCATCRYFKPPDVGDAAALVGELPSGECHAQSPRPTVAAIVAPMGLSVWWPPVRPDEFCGDWAPLPQTPGKNG
jgi:hypothetical protein